MNFFVKKSTWKNWELSLIKIPAAAFGIILGAYFADFLKPLIPALWFILILSAIWPSIVWLRQMSK